MRIDEEEHKSGSYLGFPGREGLSCGIFLVLSGRGDGCRNVYHSSALSCYTTPV